MGMFDYLKRSYDLGPQFTNVECQTKDIEDGIGGTMTAYWLDPAGQLWRPNYIGTNTFEGPLRKMILVMILIESF